MQTPKTPEEIKQTIATLQQLGDTSPDLELLESIYDILPPEIQLEYSQILEEEIANLKF